MGKPKAAWRIDWRPWLTFVVPGEAVGKKAPEVQIRYRDPVRKRGAFPHVHPQKATEEYELVVTRASAEAAVSLLDRLVDFARGLAGLPPRAAAKKMTAAIKAAAVAAGVEPFDGPVRLDLLIILPRPASAPARRVLPDAKPDSSNVLKSIEDGAQGVLWRNDSRITDHKMRKRFGEVPRVIATVERGLAVKVVETPTGLYIE